MTIPVNRIELGDIYDMLHRVLNDELPDHVDKTYYADVLYSKMETICLDDKTGSNSINRYKLGDAICRVEVIINPSAGWSALEIGYVRDVIFDECVKLHAEARERNRGVVSEKTDITTVVVKERTFADVYSEIRVELQSQVDESTVARIALFVWDRYVKGD